MIGLFRIFLALMLLVFVTWKFVPREIDHIDFGRLLYASFMIQPLVLISLLFQSARLGLLAGLKHIQIRRPLSAVLLCQGLNLILPGRVAEVFKATYLSNYANINLSIGVAAIFLERFVDILIVGLLGLVAFVLLSEGGNWFVFFVAGILMLSLFFLLLFENRLILLSKLLPWLRLRRFFESFLKHIVDKVRVGTLYYAILLGFMAWIASFVNIYLFIHLAGVHPLNIGGVILVFVATTIGGSVPALPGGFGGYEAAAVLVLKSYGYSLEEALSLAIVMHLSQLILPLIGSALVLSMERLGVSALIKQLRGVKN